MLPLIKILHFSHLSWIEFIFCLGEDEEVRSRNAHCQSLNTFPSDVQEMVQKNHLFPGFQFENVWFMLCSVYCKIAVDVNNLGFGDFFFN